MKSLNVLVQRWLSENVLPLPGESANAVKAAFGRLGSLATADVIDLYAAIGGMNNMDAELWRYWPLAEIVAENTTSSPFGILFADYMVSSWCYRLKEISQSTSAVYIDFFDGGEPKLIAESLEEFLNKYIEDPTSLLYGAPAAR